MAIKIDKGIPVAANVKMSYRGRWPWAAMKVGDSFFAPGYATSRIDGRHRFGLSWVKKTLPNKKFVIADVTENKVQGVRCWRVK